MAATEQVNARNRRDWIIILLILLFGFMCIILASGWALRLKPLWELNANAESLIDPNSIYLTSKPNGFYEPVDPAIMTSVGWVDVYLTPGAALPANVQLQAVANGSSTPTSEMTSTFIATQTIAPTTSPTTIASATTTSLPPPSATNVIVYIPPAPTKTPKPVDTSLPPTATMTSVDTSTPTDTQTAATATDTNTPTATFTPTDTPTATATDTNTPTPTFTPSPTNTLSPTPTPTNVSLAFNCFLSPVTIGASGTYPVPASGVCFRFPNPGFTYGGVFTVQELSGNNGSLTWYGKANATDTTCSTYPQTAGLSANGTVTIAVHKVGGYMYIEVSGATTSVQIDIVNWSDTGCQ